MSPVVITVAGITQPAPGKKQGSLVDTTGKMWKVWADKIHLYAPGNSYNITYKTNNFNNTTYYIIDQSTQVGSAAIAPPPPPQRGPAPATPQTRVPDPAPINRDEMIFVCGALNNLLANPNVDANGVDANFVIMHVNEFRKAFKATLGARPHRASDMDDEIPF